MTTTTCDTCETSIGPEDKYVYSSVDGLTLCETCSPTWSDFVRNPDGFYDEDGVAYTSETAAPYTAAYLIRGGSLMDSMATTNGMTMEYAGD